ncbi:hypothetical protein EV192_11047 [Actinocrispum wychmicini]|uniref:Uncharacterized protein n=2 Tax=Actinocrispum wychmicini TaxID=1213861 RepID=A0A4R2JA00_9PSEU|nr:hypothetical protein EV192_11047 [Actinocrispum wychmicini]
MSARSQAAIVAAAGALLLSGCSSEQTTETRLPIDTYTLTGQDSVTLGNAYEWLVSDCMRRFGYTYPPTLKQASASAPAATNLALRYGISNPDAAAHNGYHHPPSGTKVAPPSVDQSEELVLDGGQDPMTAADMTPTPQERPLHNGLQIPDHGCSGEAYRTLYGNGGTPGDAPIVTTISAETFTSSRQDHRVTDAAAAWSRCMARYGHQYSAPEDPPTDDRFATPTPSRSEIATATDDVVCKQRAKFIETWNTVEIEHQNKEIQAHNAELAAVKKARENAVLTANRILADPLHKQ